VDFKQSGCNDVNWIQLAKDRIYWLVVFNTGMNFTSVKGEELLQ
jgi:hypothetical protein